MNSRKFFLGERISADAVEDLNFEIVGGVVAVEQAKTGQLVQVDESFFVREMGVDQRSKRRKFVSEGLLPMLLLENGF